MATARIIGSGLRSSVPSGSRLPVRSAGTGLQTQLRTISGNSSPPISMPKRSNNPVHNAGYNQRGTAIGRDYIQTDPERFVKDGQETKRLIDQMKNTFYDFESFKLNVKGAFNNDKSLANLVDASDDRDWKALFDTKYVQSLIKNNTEYKARSYLAQKLRISHEKAGIMLAKMSRPRYAKFLQNVNNMDRAFDIIQKQKQTMPLTTSVSLNKVTQQSRNGTIYQRAKPVKWSDRQVQFLRNNMGRNTKDIYRDYVFYFKTFQRSERSISNKVYRLKKTKPQNL